MIRAWHVHDGEPGEASVLVFAESRNRAKCLALGSDWEFEYVNLTAVLAPAWHPYAEKEMLIEDNHELPDVAPRFYAEWEPMFIP